MAERLPRCSVLMYHLRNLRNSNKIISGFSAILHRSNTPYIICIHSPALCLMFLAFIAFFDYFDYSLTNTSIFFNSIYRNFLIFLNSVLELRVDYSLYICLYCSLVFFPLTNRRFQTYNALIHYSMSK